MKIFSMLFLTYHLFFSCIPCTGAEELSTNGSFQSSNDIDQNHQDNTKDNCLPYCLCTCCGQFCSFLQISFNFDLNVNTDLQIVTFYNFSLISEVDFSFWQPPKKC